MITYCVLWPLLNYLPLKWNLSSISFLPLKWKIMFYTHNKIHANLHYVNPWSFLTELGTTKHSDTRGRNHCLNVICSKFLYEFYLFYHFIKHFISYILPSTWQLYAKKQHTSFSRHFRQLHSKCIYMKVVLLCEWPETETEIKKITPYSEYLWKLPNSAHTDTKLTSFSVFIPTNNMGSGFSPTSVLMSSSAFMLTSS